MPEGRVKPWGTAHAVYSCKVMIDGPVAVINADDYYGRRGVPTHLCGDLNSHESDDKFRYIWWNTSFATLLQKMDI